MHLRLGVGHGLPGERRARVDPDRRADRRCSRRTSGGRRSATGFFAPPLKLSLPLTRLERRGRCGELRLGRLRRAGLPVDPALPQAAGGVAHDEPDEHRHQLVLLRDVDRLRHVGRLLRLGDAVRLAGLRLAAVLGDPDRDVLPPEPRVERRLELGQRGERDVRPLHLLGRRLVHGHGVRVLRPGVELEVLVRLRDAPTNVAGSPIGRARLRLVASVRRRLADRDERLGVAGLDPGVAGGGELRVGRRADDLAFRVELRGQEDPRFDSFQIPKKRTNG